MPHQLFRSVISLAALAWLATASAVHAGGGVVVDHAVRHSHDLSRHHTAAEPNPDHGGQPWATDAALREGMGRIRDAMAKASVSYDGARPTQEAASALARSIDDNVAFLIAHCTLVPQADATLHVMLGQLQNSAQVLRTDPASPDGISRIRAVLQDYPRYFSHPGWVPLEELQ